MSNREKVTEIQKVVEGLIDQLSELCGLGFLFLTEEGKEAGELEHAAKRCVAEAEKANPERLYYILASARKLSSHLEWLEKRYYVSLSVATEIRERVNLLEPEVAHDVYQAFRNWDNIRNLGTSLSSLKSAHSALIDALNRAENRSIELRMRRALTPTRATTARVDPKAEKRERDRQETAARKGYNAPTPKHGGGGTSRDAKRRARKHTKV